MNFMHFTFRPTMLVVVFMIISLFFSSGASEGDIFIGKLDGTHKLTAKDIKDGFKGSETNYITGCDAFGKYGDNFILIVEMGKFRDHLIPKEGVNVCDILTNPTSAQKYVYAPMDPHEALWDGHTERITPSLYDNALGGSAEDYVGGGRSTLSFWGDSGSNVNHTGGCCALLPNQNVAWYRPYNLLLFPKEPAFYLAWGTEPQLAVTNGPVFFEVNVWNMRSEPVKQKVEFKITINGKSMTVTSPTGRYAHYAGVPAANTTKYTITVDLVSGPVTANSKQLKAEVDVLGALPWDVTPSNDTLIPHLVHFGEMGTALGPVDRDLAFSEDWFAPTVVGGESAIRPVAGHYNTVKPPTLPSTKEMWKNVTSMNGVFQAQVSCKTVQYYAVSVYSAVDQQIVVEYEYDTAVVVYFSGKRFVSHAVDGARKESFAVQVTTGYHQVLVKLFSDNLVAKDISDCTANSTFAMRVVGTAIGYTHAVMPDMEGSYELWNNHYMFYLLHSGKERTDFLYGGLDEDFINVRTAIPKPGDPVGDNMWKQLVFYGGQIPVSAEKLPEGKEAAASYVAFAVHNAYETQIPLAWTFITGGKTDFYIDGVLVYNLSSKSGILKNRFTTPILPGWHECIVRIAATKGQSWGLTFYIHFDNYRVGGSNVPLTNLPLGVASIRPNVPLASMMELTNNEWRTGAIPFDPSNKSAADVAFTDLPINAKYKPGLLSTQRINVLGKELQYQWLSGTSTNGMWGQRALGGNFNQYWAAVLYATEAMKATLRIVLHGGYAVWLNGAVIGSAPLFVSRDVKHDMGLVKGWNQMIIKLKANNSFHMIDSKDHKLTWTQANAICAKAGNMRLCSLSAVCPFGVGRPGKIPVQGGSSFVPVGNRANEWVQVSAGGGNGTALCQTWRETHQGNAPVWGEANVDVAERHFVPCCGGDQPPSMWLSVAPSLDARGTLGYTYDIPIIVEAPVVTVSNTVALTRTVTITSTMPDATIRYKMDDAEKMSVYTGPFKITKSSTITAQAFLQDRESQQTRLFVDIPSVPSVDRVACISNQTCPLLVSGVDPGHYLSLLDMKFPDKQKKFYLRLSFAKQQKASLNFSGVLQVDANNNVVVPPLGTGVFHVIVYNKGRGTFVIKHLVYVETQLGPSDVIGAQHTPFHIKGGVMRGDAVLLPFGPTGSPADCDVNACVVGFNQNKGRIAVLSSNNDTHFVQDLYGYAGNLSCLCLCLSCSKDKFDPTTVLIEPSKVVGQSVRIRVSKPPAPTGTIVEAVRPSLVSDSDVVEMYGTFSVSSKYTVQFSPMAAGGDPHVSPLCAIQSVQVSALRCKMQVQAGTMGTWKLSLMEGHTSVPFLEESLRVLQIHPPHPSVEFATGNCAAASANCVTGAKLTFHGANFDSVHLLYNEVVVSNVTAADRIQCNVATVNKTELSCTLVIPLEKKHGTYPISIRVRVSETQWGTMQSAGFLVLGAGTNAPGWQANNTPLSPSNEDIANNTVFIVGLVIGILLLVFIVCLSVVITCLCLSSHKEEEITDPMELQLIDAERESVETLRKNTDIKYL